MSDTPRLDALEQMVRDLALEVERLRAELRDARRDNADDRPSPSHAAAPAGHARARPPSIAGTRAAGQSRRSEAPPRWQSMGIETLIGRYGALALAALAILLGVGVFLSWAVEHIRLGPEARVLLGALTAAAVAALGAWLRRRGARRFGNVLFGLALAIAHVVAWGAGPYLRVVPAAAALVGAAAASAALAVLAWREGEEALFAVGLGGALIAPFVTSAGESAVVPLLVFGLLVTGSGMLAVGSRPWRVAVRLLMAGFGLYAGAALAMPGGALGNLGDAVARAAPATFALVCAWSAMFIAGVPHRLPLGRAALAVGVIALLTAGLAREGVLHAELIVVALGITISTYALLWRTAADLRAAIVLPLGALVAALTAIPDAASPLGASLAAAWAVIAAASSLAGGLPVLARRDTGASAQRETGATTRGETGAATSSAPPRIGEHFVAVIAAATAVVLQLHDRPIVCIIALAAVGATAALLTSRVEAAGLIAGSLIVLLVGTGWSIELLADRAWYAYAPFLSRESAAAAALVGAWWAWSWSAARWSGAQEGAAGTNIAVRLLAPLVTFGWGYIELSRAFSREMATFLIILYLAACGVTAILLGRARALPPARHAGLALAIIAGLRALAQAGDLGFGLRLATYLLVGAFLLGVAYLYRATSDPVVERSAGRPVARPGPPVAPS